MPGCQAGCVLEGWDEQIGISFQSSTDVCCRSPEESRVGREGMLPKYSECQEQQMKRFSVPKLYIMVSQVASAAPQCHILNPVPLCCTRL